MVELNNLSAEDAIAILELTPTLDIAFVKPIGASERKFYIETTQGVRRLLRITPIENHQWVKDDHIYAYMETAGINVSRQVSEGFFCGGAMIYQLWTWIDGEDLSVALPCMSHAEQFAIGLKFGEAARKIHTLPPMDNPEAWKTRYKRKMQETIQSYNNKAAKSREEDLLIQYLQDNQGLLDNRPTTFIKGDWNTGNLMISPDGQIWLIDCGQISGDPWWEFWEVNGNDACFNTGQVKGYFGGEPPEEYFPLFALYVAKEYLGWYPDDAKHVLGWFDGMRNPVPAWYLKDYNVL